MLAIYTLSIILSTYAVISTARTIAEYIYSKKENK